jgi:aminoglycoside/choline kinase family phosphotransferase
LQVEQLAKLVAPYFQGNPLTLTQIAGDGSDRKFFRASASPDSAAAGKHSSLIIMHGAGELSQAETSNRQWVEVGRDLALLGLKVPAVLEVLHQHGAVLMEDFGDRTFGEGVVAALQGGDKAQLEALYQQGFTLIGTLLSAPQESWSWLKALAFDRAKFSFELDFFALHYGKNLGRFTLSSDEAVWFARDCTALASFLSEHLPLRGVHRDFHSRNLMLCADDKLGLIDFQDMRRGPLPYDLVSLCFDSYVPLTIEQRLSLMKRGVASILAQCPEISGEEFADDIWRAVLLQRQLKAMGSFAYLARVKGKREFLRYLVPASETLINLYDPRWPFLSGEFIERHVRAKVGADSINLSHLL